MKTINEYVGSNDYINTKRFFIDEELKELMKLNYSRQDCISEICEHIKIYCDLGQYDVVLNLGYILNEAINGTVFNREIINEMFNKSTPFSFEFEEFKIRVYREKTLKPKNVIYKITCSVNSKIYIGSSSDFLKRKIIHRYCLKFNMHHNKYLQADYNQFGEECFTYEIMHECDKNIERDELYLLEQIYVDKYNPEYNILRDKIAFSGKKSKYIKK